MFLLLGFSFVFLQFGAEDQRPFKIRVGSDRIRNQIKFGDLKRREGSVSAIGDGDVGDARTLRFHKWYSQLPEQGAGEASRGQGTRQHTHALQKWEGLLRVYFLLSAFRRSSCCFCTLVLLLEILFSRLLCLLSLWGCENLENWKQWPLW